MNIVIEHRNLFTMPKEYYLAHCISADFALGAGIAKTFSDKYKMRIKLFEKHGVYAYRGGDALLVDKVFNLVTKAKFWQKPTYESLREALERMKEQILSMGITKLAMPKIGCGLDRLDWNKVFYIICDVFDDTDIEIIICEL